MFDNKVIRYISEFTHNRNEKKNVSIDQGNKICWVMAIFVGQ
jgi:hypothetical protein